MIASTNCKLLNYHSFSLLHLLPAYFLHSLVTSVNWLQKYRVVFWKLVKASDFLAYYHNHKKQAKAFWPAALSLTLKF